MSESSAGLKQWCLGLAAMTGLALCIAPSPAAAQAPAAPPPTIAVLPLENNSGDAAQDFFAGGMTDEIASALTSVRGLGVVARSSSFRLPPSMRDTKTIGQTLNTRYLVLGTARMAADRMQFGDDSHIGPALGSFNRRTHASQAATNDDHIVLDQLRTFPRK